MSISASQKIGHHFGTRTEPEQGAQPQHQVSRRQHRRRLRHSAEARASGTSRRIKHYIEHLQQGTPVMDRDRPSDATLAEWIRHCKRSGLYEQGKLLYERGGPNLDNLLEKAMFNVEEDHQVCARVLARNGGNEKKRKR